MEAVSTAVLVGNTFPLTLVRGWKVEIEEVGAEALRGALASGAAVQCFNLMTEMPETYGLSL